MKLSENNFPQRSDEIVWRKIGEEIVIMTEDGRRIHTLNDVGGTIWELSDGTRPIKEIISRICELYEVSHDKASEDVNKFVMNLLNEKVLKISRSTDN